MKKKFTQLWKLMKICLCQMIIGMTLCGMVIAHENRAQLLDRKVTLSVADIPLEQAIRELGQAGQVDFFYSIDHLEIGTLVSVEARDEKLGDVLRNLLLPHGISFKVNETKAVIFLKRADMPGGETAPASNGKEVFRTVSGTVTDADTRLPMAGVNVLVKGTVNGTTTGGDGTYSLTADDSDILVFSFIGYAAAEVAVGSRTVIDVALVQDVKSLGEVVVNAGYYETTRELQTGNIVKVESKDIERQPVQNPLAALQGRVAGMEIVQATGVPGGNFRVRIRGTNSIANGNDPLFIVDGVPYTSTPLTFSETSSGILGNSLNPMGGSSPLSNINPSDIESIEVLKDADATAIYGSRGANGVVLITTKKGKAGATRVSFNGYTGFGKVTRRMEMLDTRQYVAMRKEAFLNDGVTPTLSNARDLLEWDTTRYTDWQDELIGGVARTTNAQLSLSGGNEITRFSVGAGYYRETTVFPGDNADQRISARLNVTNNGFDGRLRTMASVNVSAGMTDLLNQDLTRKAISLPPNAPALYDDSGNLNWEGWASSGNLENPLSYLNRRYEAHSGNLIGSVETGYLVLPALEIKTRLGFTTTSLDAVNLKPISALAPSAAANAENTTSFSNSTFRNWVVEPQVQWKPRTGDHRFELLAGTQFLDQVTDGLAQTATGFSSEVLMKNLTAAPNRTLGTNYYANYRYHAVFGRINYNFDNRYIVNLTGRRDGSSRFGPGRQFANFGAVGFAWILSNEKIFDQVGFLSFAKLRGSAGVTGNDQLTDYQYLDAYTSSSGTYLGSVGLRPARLANPDFAWETNRKLEAALDLGFLDGKISFSLSAYLNRSSNQLVGYPLPPSTGFTAVQANLPAIVQNSGVEIELNTTTLERNNFSWSTFLNISVPRNKLVAYPDLENSAYAQTYIVGEPLTARRFYQYTGVDPQTGLYTIADADNNGTYNYDDRTAIRSRGHQYYGGLQNSLQYKSFRLDVLLQFVRQQGFNYLYYKPYPGFVENQPTFVLERWQEETQFTNIQRFGQSSPVSQAYARVNVSDRTIDDASFVRLKTLSVSYDLTDAQLAKIRLEGLRFYIQCQNLLTITKYKGLDPESQGTYLPPLKVIATGLMITL